MIDVNKAIATVVKTGKVLLGTKKAVENAKLGRARLIVAASNCPRNILEEITYYGKLSNVPVSIYKGTSIDLGAVCGKPYPVSALTVREPGDSDILRLGEKPREESIDAEETAEETDA
jgi:large subunit ribosomal protein L30e